MFSFIHINKVTLTTAVGIFLVLAIMGFMFSSLAIWASAIFFAIFAVCVPISASRASQNPTGGLSLSLPDLICLVSLLACVLFFVIGLSDALETTH